MVSRNHIPMVVIFILIESLIAISLSACSERGLSAIQTSDLRAWLDQPPDGASIPLAPFMLKAHARGESSRVSQIAFLVNGIAVGTVNVEQSQPLAYGELSWNPSAGGEYDIQAQAVGNSATALSDLAHICVATGDSNVDGCSVAANPVQKPPKKTTPSAATPQFKFGALPNPIYLGSCSNSEQQTLVFEAVISDIQQAIEIDLLGALVSKTGKRQEFITALKPDGTGAYKGSYDLSTFDVEVFENQEGLIEYSIGLMNERKEFFARSENHTIKVLLCQQNALELKLGASPNPVYIGECKKGEPQTINIEGYASDASKVLEAVIQVSLLNVSGFRLEMYNQAMQSDGKGVYTVSLPVGQADPKLLEYKTGSLVFSMSLIDAQKNVIAKSEEGSVSLVPCSAQASDGNNQPQQQPQEQPEPQPPEPQPPETQDTTPPAINGGEPSANVAYYDPKGSDPKNCAPLSVSVQAEISDASAIDYVVIYWYWTSEGDPYRAEFAPMSGSGSSYTYTFSPDRGNDTLVYWIKAADQYNNVAQSSSFNFRVSGCP